MNFINNISGDWNHRGRLLPAARGATIMRSPEGEEFPGNGCFLEIRPNHRLVWTDALLPGFRLAEKPFFTAILAFEPEGNGTRYKAVAVHRDEASRKRHEEMGFQEGWGKCLDQLVAHVKTF